MPLTVAGQALPCPCPEYVKLDEADLRPSMPYDRGIGCPGWSLNQRLVALVRRGEDAVLRAVPFFPRLRRWNLLVKDAVGNAIGRLTNRHVGFQSVAG